MCGFGKWLHWCNKVVIITKKDLDIELNTEISPAAKQTNGKQAFAFRRLDHSVDLY